MIDFASELPATYYGLYVLGLGETETILRAIGLAQFLALASMHFQAATCMNTLPHKPRSCLRQ